MKFDGDLCYALRCAFLHSGDLKVTTKTSFVKCVQLFYNSKGDNVLYYGLNKEEKAPEKRYMISINVDYLCRAIAQSALHYYDLCDTKRRQLLEDHEVKIWNAQHKGVSENEFRKMAQLADAKLLGTWRYQSEPIPLLLPEQYNSN